MYPKCEYCCLAYNQGQLFGRFIVSVDRCAVEREDQRQSTAVIDSWKIKYIFHELKIFELVPDFCPLLGTLDGFSRKLLLDELADQEVVG